MGDVIRDSGESHPCPRCGLPVTYGGRGRRPIWCSATCRVEASIERRGNRIVGVEPRLVRIVDLTAQGTSARHVAVPALDDSALVEGVLGEPELAQQVIDGIGARAAQGDPDWKALFDSITPTSEKPPVPVAQRRPVEGWCADLELLRHALVSGAIYERELAELATALSPVLDAYTRRVEQRR